MEESEYNLSGHVIFYPTGEFLRKTHTKSAYQSRIGEKPGGSMNRSIFFVSLSLFLFICFATQSAYAEIPRMISYQGRVMDGGSPVSDGTYTMQFRLFNSSSGGTQRWESGDVDVDVSGGVFSVLLGESPQPVIILYFDEDLWLQVTFEGVIQTPRQRLASVGYAYMASGLVPGTQISAAMFGQVLEIDNTETSGAADGINSTVLANNGYAMYAQASSSTGFTRGAYGRASSPDGRGVMGYNASTTGDAYGVYAETNSSTGRAVYGWATNESGVNYGGRFITDSESGRGCYGWASSTIGTTYGGAFKSSSPDGYGVWGKSEAGSGLYTYGVYGVCVSTQGSGVRGEAPKNGAVTGIATATSGTNWGGKFYASESPDGVGVYGQGDDMGGYFTDSNGSGYAHVGYGSYKIQGSGSVSFVQNHPVESDRVIVYAAPEGDEVATYTRGTAQLIDGEAVVSLGETFKWVTNPDIGLTAHLTPRSEPVPLAVVELSTDKLVVRGPKDAASDIVFDYIVYGLRIGFEEQSIVQKKEREAFIPSMDDHRDMYASYPDLRNYNALQRYKNMYSKMGILSGIDFTSSSSLRDAIQEYDPAIHGECAETVHIAGGEFEDDSRAEIDSSRKEHPREKHLNQDTIKD